MHVVLIHAPRLSPGATGWNDTLDLGLHIHNTAFAILKHRL